VLWPDLMDQRETGVPIARTVSFFDSREVRHKSSIRPGQLHRYHGTKTKDVGVLCQFRAGFRLEVAERDIIAGRHVQSIDEPLADDDLVLAHPGWRIRKTRGGNHGIRSGGRARGK